MACWHKWPKWKEVSRGLVVVDRLQPAVMAATAAGAPVDDKTQTASPLFHSMYVVQSRVCDKCGKEQLREERSS